MKAKKQRLIDANELKVDISITRLFSETDALYVEAYSEELINDAPTVEAIPIEWIKEWLTNRLLYDDSVCGLLEDWRKEKERQSVWKN